MKIGFTGTQDGVTVAQHDLLITVISELTEMTEAHHGECVGADYTFHSAVSLIHPDVEINGHPPENDKKRAVYIDLPDVDVRHDPEPYLVRNHNIVDATELLIACPKGPEVLRSGTWATIRYARKTGKPVAILWGDGKYTYENQSSEQLRKTEKNEDEKAQS